jgi:large subunit ribosomal protein L30
MSDLKITLKKSIIRSKQDQKATVAALGLHKTGSSIVQKDNPQIRGMIKKVEHLVQVEEI